MDRWATSPRWGFQWAESGPWWKRPPSACKPLLAGRGLSCCPTWRRASLPSGVGHVESWRLQSRASSAIQHVGDDQGGQQASRSRTTTYQFTVGVEASIARPSTVVLRASGNFTEISFIFRSRIGCCRGLLIAAFDQRGPSMPDSEGALVWGIYPGPWLYACLSHGVLHHNGLTMASRVPCTHRWAARTASVAFWGPTLAIRPRPFPRTRAPSSLDARARVIHANCWPAR